ncbi:Gfo/Idh/MocA family protein [Pelosinus sp. sgz500959]|uniref:Gfo/Idh/MocA family protein n=1 Tax=Pelosinus sp. sgz500959 TaxID=3242472 RepID=UPI0036708FBD
MEKLKVALIGCGRISYKHIDALVHNCSEVELVATCDVVIENAEEKARDYIQKMQKASFEVHMPRMYSDYNKMLKDEQVDIVTICTKSGNHAEISLACLSLKKHVLVEKPMALSTQDADAMIECARDHGVKLCVAHQNRFNLPVQKLRQAVEEGRFGKIFAGNARILWNRNEDYYAQAPWRGTYTQDGGCLMNQCIHNIDLLQWMLGGDMAEIQAMIANYIHPYIEAEDYGSIQILFHSGAIGNVEGTVCVYPQNLEETLTILGEKGTVVIGGRALDKILVWQFADKKDTLEEIQQECNREIDHIYGWGHTTLYGNLIKSIKTNQEPLVNGLEGKKAMSIILHAYQASYSRQRINVSKKCINALDFKLPT